MASDSPGADPHNDLKPCWPQRKTNGVKAVITLSSSAAQMSLDSKAARAIDAPAGPFDKLQMAYKVSKAALNQGVCLRGALHDKCALYDYSACVICIHVRSGPGACLVGVMCTARNSGVFWAGPWMCLRS